MFYIAINPIIYSIKHTHTHTHTHSFFPIHSISIHFTFQICTSLWPQSDRVVFSPFIVTLFINIILLSSGWKFLKGREQHTAHKSYLEVLNATWNWMEGCMEEWMADEITTRFFKENFKHQKKLHCSYQQGYPQSVQFCANCHRRLHEQDVTSGQAAEIDFVGGGKQKQSVDNIPHSWTTYSTLKRHQEVQLMTYRLTSF